MEHSPEVLHIPPGTPCIFALIFEHFSSLSSNSKSADRPT